MAHKRKRVAPVVPPPAAVVSTPAAAPARDSIVIAGLALLCLAVFGQIATFGFINFDDSLFVFENPAVRAGLSSSSIHWALTSTEIGYYPLTWLSHMADVQLWGLRAAGHHATAVLLHFLSSLLLYLAFRKMTGAALPSALVAALFAIHPAHVESVAWVSERKDTLSTLFGLLALWLYAGKPSVGRYIGVAVALVASLLSKQMLVTLPFIFLLLDYWPLRRIDSSFRGAAHAITQKLPFFAIAAAGSIVAIVGQKNLNAIQTSSALPLGDRIANALVAYASYLGKLVWPVDLAPLYPLTRVSFAAAFGSFFLLAAISVAVWILRKSDPWLIVGWLWFLGSLVPVIGIVQIGSQSMADRYTYFPYIGLFIAIAFEAVQRLPLRAFVAAGAVVVVILAALAFHQTRYWKDTDTLFTHTLAVTGPNPLAEYTLGQSLQLSDPDRAIPHLRRALTLAEIAFGGVGAAAQSPFYAQSHIGIGTALIMKARSTPDLTARTRLLDAATAELQTALRLDPMADVAKRNLALAESMKPKQAAAPSPTAMLEAKVDPLIDAGIALLREKRFDEAVTTFQKAVAIDPNSVETRVYLGLGLAQANRPREAAAQLREAKRIDPARANRFVTGALRKKPSDDNLDLLILQLDR